MNTTKLAKHLRAARAGREVLTINDPGDAGQRPWQTELDAAYWSRINRLWYDGGDGWFAFSDGWVALWRPADGDNPDAGAWHWLGEEHLSFRPYVHHVKPAEADRLRREAQRRDDAAQFVALVEDAARAALALLEQVQGAAGPAYWSQDDRPAEVAAAYEKRLAPAIAELAGAFLPTAPPADPYEAAIIAANGPDWQGRGHVIGNACRKARDAYYHYQAYARTHDSAGGWQTSGNYNVDAIEGFAAPKLPGWQPGEQAISVLNAVLLALDMMPGSRRLEVLQQALTLVP